MFEESFYNYENPTKVKQYLQWLIEVRNELFKIPRTLENKRSAELLPQYIISNILLPIYLKLQIKKTSTLLSWGLEVASDQWNSSTLEIERPNCTNLSPMQHNALAFNQLILIGEQQCKQHLCTMFSQT